MPKLTFHHQLPTAEEFQQRLGQAIHQTSPLEDLLDLAYELYQYEQQYQLSSSQFYQQYQAGLLADELQHCVEWATAYTTFLETKRLLEVALMRAALQITFTEASYGTI